MDDVILNKAAILERCIRRIKEEYIGFEQEFKTNYTKQDSIILNIQSACECAIDMATHIVRIQKLGVPLASREVFELLANHEIISSNLSDALQRMVGFRNIAVHDYVALKLPVIEKVITHHLRDLEQFSQVLLKTYI
jgi:uncharacterized protein YutE (UPF0331/DUF86 family)